MKTRMNLFRQLDAPKKPAFKPKTEFKLGVAGSAALGFTGLAILGMAFTYFGHRSTLNELHRKMEEAQAQLAASMAETDRLSAEIGRRKKEQLEKASQRQVAGGPVITDKIEPSWSALLWKISAFTGTRILISQMDLNYAPGNEGNPSAGRSLVLQGGAASLGALRDWVDILIRAVPGYDFAIDNQNSSGAGDFPVSFRLSARVL